jgi:glutathione S-transferase
MCFKTSLGAKMRALLFTTGSPFARAARVILHELGLDYERREEITTPTVAERAGATPTLQVPTLWDGEMVLWESGLIADYLLNEYRERPSADPPLATDFARPDSKWADKRIFATVQTLGAAATIISQMKWSGVEHQDSEYLTRSADRLPHLMKWLEEQLPNEQQGFFRDAVSAQDIFLACHLGFIANRPIGLDPDIEKHPKISALVTRMEARDSFSENPILWWEPGVVGYAEDGRTPVYKT